jgi:hypothetical protein
VLPSPALGEDETFATKLVFHNKTAVLVRMPETLPEVDRENFQPKMNGFVCGEGDAEETVVETMVVSSLRNSC